MNVIINTGIGKMKIVKIKYNQGLNAGYFIKHRKGYMPIFFEESIFAELQNIVDEKEVDINLDGSVTTL